MVRTAIQLYTLRDLEGGLPDLLRRIGETEFDGVEFAGFGETSARETAEVLKATGLEAASAHIGIDVLEDDPDSVREACTALECEHVVVPHLAEEHFEDSMAVRETATRLSDLADRLADRDLALGYHNHDHEFVDLVDDDRSAFELLLDVTDDALSIELDVGWATAAGHDPIALLERLERRAPLVHIKDIADGHPVELGDGVVDIDGCVAAARDAGAEWLIYEHDEPVDPAASLEHGAQTLAEYHD